MQMHLYVLGPAFDLPSIDAECIAVVTLLKLRYGNDATNWTLSACHDLSIRLPYLVTNGTTISGFSRIAKHVAEQSNDATTALESHQHSDATALASFLTSHASPLLSIYLYVSAENYRTTTRPAFTRILPLYARFIIPPTLRSSARKRTKHLGLGALDVDTLHDQPSEPAQQYDAAESSFEADTKQRASLLLPRKETVRSLLARRPESTAVFKLRSLADALLGPLEDVLGENDWLLGSKQPQEIDCLAYGCLSLMLYAPVPQDWLAKTMRQRYKRLTAYVERLRTTLDVQTSVKGVTALDHPKTPLKEASTRNKSGLTLPWTTKARSGVTDIAASILNAIRSQIPTLKPPFIAAEGHAKQNIWAQYAIAGFITTGAVLVAGGYWTFRSGLLLWPQGEEVHIFGRKRISDYSHVASALAGLSLLGQQAIQDQAFHEQESLSNQIPVEVGVEVEAENVR